MTMKYRLYAPKWVIYLVKAYGYDFDQKPSEEASQVFHHGRIAIEEQFDCSFLQSTQPFHLHRENRDIEFIESDFYKFVSVESIEIETLVEIYE